MFDTEGLKYDPYDTYDITMTLLLYISLIYPFRDLTSFIFFQYHFVIAVHSVSSEEGGSGQSFINLRLFLLHADFLYIFVIYKQHMHEYVVTLTL